MIRRKNWRHIFRRMYVVYTCQKKCHECVDTTNTCRFIFLDLFGKAKKKILKQDEMSYSFANSVPSTTARLRSPESDWEPREIGIDSRVENV